ncbi:aldo/keto reductase [Escherichia coli]|nr:aldo/keto reductase [Escherichia coli]EJT3156706.1 aldo/keto reductase [Escherichia coli]EJT9872137.1 aldo/keto reductase [Escherichia coli]
MQQKMIQFSGDVSLPAIGQGTWYMGEDASQRKTEVAALRAGIELGLTLIDTAEMYADGGAEKVVGEALTGLRDNVFLVSKVYPWNAGGQKAINACEASLRRLNTDYLDLYLLHWSGSFAFEETVAAMEKLIAQGKIRRWGVSNLDHADMQELWQLPVMAYSPLAQAGRLRNGLLKNAVVNEIAHAHNISAAQVLLAWVISHQGVMAIPKAATIAHVQQNAAVLEVELSSAELTMLDKAYPAPKGKTALDMV